MARTAVMLLVLFWLAWPVQAYTLDALVCPVREGWEAESEECPCQKGWKPTVEDLRKILKAAKAKQENRISTVRPITPQELSELRDYDTNTADVIGPILCNVDLSEANVNDFDLTKANLQGANLRKANLKGAILTRANLEGATLAKATLTGAHLREADLQNAYLIDADLNDADLTKANLEGALLGGANLEGAHLAGANLKGANLLLAKVKSANLSFAALEHATYAPASPPPDNYLEGVVGLATVTFPEGRQSGLVQLRELLKSAGLRNLERQATYAIEGNTARHARCDLTERDIPIKGHLSSDKSFAAEVVATAKHKCREEVPIHERVGGWLKLIFFEWTTGWGLYPSRALAILLALMGFLGIVYAIPIAASPTCGSGRHGIYRIRPPGHITRNSDQLSLAEKGQVERLSANMIASFAWGFFFSMLSAFHIGWRDLNVGTWLSRIQPTEFELLACGWVRVVSGLQSLASVYLVAMWALTYFGRPFQ